MRFAPQLLSEDARFSAGMFAAQAAGALVNQGDRMLVAAVGSPAMAGLYALCVSIANKTVAAVVAITSFVFPHAAGLQSAGQHDATIGLVHALDRAIAVLLVPVLVPGLLLAETFLSLWLGDFATPELAAAFRILLIAFAILAFAIPISNVFVASGKSGMSARYCWLTVGVVFRHDVLRGATVRVDRRCRRDAVRLLDVATVRRQCAARAGDTTGQAPGSILARARAGLCCAGGACRSPRTARHRLARAAHTRRGRMGELLSGARHRRRADAGGETACAAVLKRDRAWSEALVGPPSTAGHPC